MTILILILTLLCFMPPGQTTKKKADSHKCSLVVERSPEIRGLKLGQPFVDLDTVLPRPSYLSRDRKPDDVGWRREIFIPLTMQEPERLKGISMAEVSYLDDRLASITITYDTSVLWESNLHFTSAIAEQLKLPMNGWYGEINPRLTCNGFFVETSFSQKLSIELTTFRDELQKRRAIRDQQKRVEFKP